MRQNGQSRTVAIVILDPLGFKAVASRHHLRGHFLGCFSIRGQSHFRDGCPLCGPRKDDCYNLRWPLMAMVWKSLCGLLQQIHRKLRFLPKPMEAALDPSREVRRDGPVPRSGRPHVTSVLSNTISRGVRTYELRLMLQKHDSLCVAKECRISLSRAWFSGAGTNLAPSSRIEQHWHPSYCSLRRLSRLLTDTFLCHVVSIPSG